MPTSAPGSGPASSTELSPLSVLGFTAREEQLYRLLLRHSGSPLTVVAELAGLRVGELREQVSRFAGVGVVEARDDVVVARPPQEALGLLITQETRRVQNRAEQLEAVRDLLPSLHADHLAASVPGGRAVSVEVIEGGAVGDLIRSLSASSTGDVRWLRPDPWNLPESTEVDQCALDLLRSGRTVRAIYPVRVLSDPELVRTRALAGEQLRVLRQVPARLAIFGSTAVLISERIGVRDGRRMIVRDPILVATLTSLFESMWDRALSVPALDGQRGEERVSQQRQLMRQLAGGAKDEQIARALGLSLRTVRRRIAELLDDLGAESRFQAGVEATRRGWL